MTLSDLSTLNLQMEIDENHLNDLISTYFEPISINKRDTISGMKLKGECKNIELELSLNGRYNGTVAAVFTPDIDNDSKKIKLNNLQISLKETSLLSKGLNWILQSKLKSRLQDIVQSQLDKNLLNLVNEYINKEIHMPLPQELIAKFQITDVRIRDFKFKKNILFLDLETLGRLKLLSNSVLALASAKKK